MNPVIGKPVIYTPAAGQVTILNCHGALLRIKVTAPGSGGVAGTDDVVFYDAPPGATLPGSFPVIEHILYGSTVANGNIDVEMPVQDGIQALGTAKSPALTVSVSSG